MVYPQQAIRPYQSLHHHHHHHPLKLQSSSPKSLSSVGSIESFDDYIKYNSTNHSIESSFTKPPSKPNSLPGSKSKSTTTTTTTTTLPRRPPVNEPKFVLPNLPKNTISTLPFPSSSYPSIKLDLKYQSSTESLTTPTSNIFHNSHLNRFLDDLSPTSPLPPSTPSSTDPSSSDSSYFPNLSIKPILNKKPSKLFQSLSSTDSQYKSSNSDINLHLNNYSFKPKSEFSSSQKQTTNRTYSPKPQSETSHLSSETSYSPCKPRSEISYFSDSSSDSETALIESTNPTNSNSNSSSNTNLWWWEKVNKYRKNSIDSIIKAPPKKQIKKLKKKTSSSTKDDWFLILDKEKHHPLDENEVPYWMSYQHEVLDHHILMMYACSPNPFSTITNPSGHQKVLDLGCGPYAIWCNGVLRTTKNPELELVGLDICPIQLKKLPKGMEFVQHDFLKSSLPFPNHTFDQVNASFLGSGVPEKKWTPLIAEIFRILKPGHHLTICETNYDSSELQSLLKSHTISSTPTSIIPSELALIGTQLKRSRVLFNEIPTSVFQTPILSSLENQRLLLSTREGLITASKAKLKAPSKPSSSPPQQGEIVGLLNEKFGWVCEMDLEMKRILETRLENLQETFDSIQSPTNPSVNLSSSDGDGESEEIELGEIEEDSKEIEIKTKLNKLIHSIRSELNSIELRLSNQSNLEFNLDQNSIHIETFCVKTYRDKSSTHSL